MRTLGQWTARQRTDARRLYLAGHGANAVGGMIGVPRRTVQRWMKADGVMRSRSEAEQLKRHGRIVFTDEAEHAIVDAHERGIPKRRVCRDLGITEATVYSVLRRRRPQEAAISRSLAHARRWNNPATDAGRARLERIVRAVRLQQEGSGQYAIARAIGVWPQCALALLRTPYADALRAMIYGGTTRIAKAPLAQAMYWRQGLPVGFIARCLEADERSVDQWINNRR